MGTRSRPGDVSVACIDACGRQRLPTGRATGHRAGSPPAGKARRLATRTPCIQEKTGENHLKQQAGIPQETGNRVPSTHRRTRCHRTLRRFVTPGDGTDNETASTDRENIDRERTGRFRRRQGGRSQAKEREEKTRARPESAGRKEGGARGWGISSTVLTGAAATTTRGGARTGARTANSGMTCRTGASRSPMTAHSGQQSSMSERVNSEAGAAPSSSITTAAWSGCPDTGGAGCCADAWPA